MSKYRLLRWDSSHSAGWGIQCTRPTRSVVADQKAVIDVAGLGGHRGNYALCLAIATQFYYRRRHENIRILTGSLRRKRKLSLAHISVVSVAHQLTRQQEMRSIAGLGWQCFLIGSAHPATHT